MVTQKEEKERRRLKRDKMASYFLDLSKVTFTAMVVGSVTPLLDDGTAIGAIMLLVGLSFTIVLAVIGYIMLNI